MFHKICFIFFMLIFICLYLYVKTESFITTIPQTIPQTTRSDILISTQLTSEIARILSISSRRIINVNYTGDISSGSLMVAFIILEPNESETKNQEPSASDTAKLAHQMTTSGTFKVFINGLSILLYKLPKPTTNSNSFFDNSGLKDISKYSNSKYVSVPNDASLTNFYKLGFDSNFNIVPKLEPIITSSNQTLPTQALNFA